MSLQTCSEIDLVSGSVMAGIQVAISNDIRELQETFVKLHGDSGTFFIASSCSKIDRLGPGSANARHTFVTYAVFEHDSADLFSFYEHFCVQN